MAPKNYHRTIGKNMDIKVTFSKNFRREQNNFPNPSNVYPFLMILFPNGVT